jgi:hypothetical protein
MRISFHVPGYVYEVNMAESEQDTSVCSVGSVNDENIEEPIEDISVLSALDGWRYEGGNMYNYIDMELVDQGVAGGIIRAIWTPERGLEVVIDYWAPDTLSASYINQLRDDTRGQLSDGIGECGFEIMLDCRDYVLVAGTDKAPEVEIVYDGKPIPTPSRIAQAARDGNTLLLEDAIASGDAIDSRIQESTGLHLAIVFGHVEAALLLIANGANTNLVVGDGDETPLHLCALSNSLSDSDSAIVAKALLKHGADKSIKTASNHTAESYAENRHKVAMLRVLQEVNEQK